MKINYSSDADWMRALKEGELPSFRLLFDLYGKRLYLIESIIVVNN